MSLEEASAEFRILAIRTLPTVELDKDLEWICRSLGFMESRDKQKTAYRIFRTLVHAANDNDGLSSDELASKLRLTRGTMVYHLNRMIKSGIAIYRGGRYKLRGRSLKSTLQEIQRDMERIFEDLYRVAETIDTTLSLQSREIARSTT